MGRLLLSLAPSESLTEEWLEALERRSSLLNLELTGEQFNHFLDRQSAVLKGLFSVKDIIPAELARNWPFEHGLLSEQLKEQLIYFLEQAAQCKVSNVSLNLGLESLSMQKGESQEQVVNLLRSVTELCQRSGMTLGLTHRFPDLVEEDVPTALATVCNTYHEAVALTVDVFPAELEDATALHGLLRKYFYRVSLIRFVTFPNLGQKLHPEFLKKAERILRQAGYDGDLVVAPHFQSADYIPNVIQHYAVLEKLIS